MDPAVVGLIGIIFAGGGLGAVVGWRRSGSESRNLAATTLIAVNAELRLELERRSQELERRDREIKALQERVTALETRAP